MWGASAGSSTKPAIVRAGANLNANSNSKLSVKSGSPFISLACSVISSSKTTYQHCQRGRGDRPLRIKNGRTKRSGVLAIGHVASLIWKSTCASGVIIRKIPSTESSKAPVTSESVNESFPFTIPCARSLSLLRPKEITLEFVDPSKSRLVYAILAIRQLTSTPSITFFSNSSTIKSSTSSSTNLEPSSLSFNASRIARSTNTPPAYWF